MPIPFELLPVVDIADQETVDAGNFATWFASMRAGAKKAATADVPCGDCNACCKSSYFIHVEPGDSAARSQIPSELLFPAPGLPEGHLLMGFNERGECPMLVDNACSIYEHRPATCRAYDCRVFAAAGIEAGGEEKAGVNSRVSGWRFRYEHVDSKELHAATQTIAALVRSNAARFPSGLTQNPSPLALFALQHAQDFLAEYHAVEQAAPDVASAHLLSWLVAQSAGQVD